MEIIEKNLTQEQFTYFYYQYVLNADKVFLAEWIIRIMPKDELEKLIGTIA
jgi:hypothetical protein